jgi:nuclear pore complex protein Nup133
VWPTNLQDVLGAGGTHGELCVRFSSEDLREPIIKDNLLDDDVLREHIEKNRLDEWYVAARRAGKAAHDAAKMQQMQAEQQHVIEEETDDDAAQDQAGDAELIEAAGSDTFEGDVESATDQEHDVAMQDS